VLDGGARAALSQAETVIIVTDSDPDSLKLGLTTGYQALDVM
jgi:hypothetical protein